MRPQRSHMLQEAQRPLKSTSAPRILIKHELLKARETQEMCLRDRTACAGALIKSLSLQPSVRPPIGAAARLIYGSN